VIARGDGVRDRSGVCPFHKHERYHRYPTIEAVGLTARCLNARENGVTVKPDARAGCSNLIRKRAETRAQNTENISNRNNPGFQSGCFRKRAVIR